MAQTRPELTRSSRRRETVGSVRQRALIHVGGQAGAGKTTFIEALLSANDEDAIIAVRCRRDESLSKARESRPKNDSELRRYASAGAIGEARYDFPDGGHNEFFMAGFMEDFSDAVVIEGDKPVDFADVEVHIAVASQGPLLVRQKRRAGPMPPASEALRALLERAGGPERVLARLLRDGQIDPVRRMEQHIETERGRDARVVVGGEPRASRRRRCAGLWATSTAASNRPSSSSTFAGRTRGNGVRPCWPRWRGCAMIRRSSPTCAARCRAARSGSRPLSRT
jgi:hypothetical protein